MASSKKKGDYDWSECTFESDARGALPAGVQRMLKRAFASFGPDGHVLSRSWTEGVPAGKSEAEWFSYCPPTDICCADGAAFVIYQTGVTDLGKVTSPWAGYWQYTNGKEEKTWFHAAPFWAPEPRNAEFLELVRKS